MYALTYISGFDEQRETSSINLFSTAKKLKEKLTHLVVCRVLDTMDETINESALSSILDRIITMGGTIKLGYEDIGDEIKIEKFPVDPDDICFNAEYEKNEHSVYITEKELKTKVLK